MPDSLYIHVPFCKSICAYCDFYRGLYNEKTVFSWLKEIRKDFAGINNVETIYIGGGTPSSLNDEQLDTLLAYCDYLLPVKEFTVEVNPENITQAKIDIMKKHGVNRVSIGIQSFNDDILKSLGRRADLQTNIKALNLLKDNFENISLDLMYSLPDQSMEDWINDLNKAVSFNIPHISFYSLTVEEGSIFYKQHKQPLDNETEYLMYKKGIEIMENNSYHQYEISNFAKDNHESLHNKNYWYYKDFTGIGPGSSSKVNDKRWTDTTKLKDYIEGKRDKELIDLSKEDILFEAVMMGLRLNEGIDLQDYKDRFNTDLLEHYSLAVKENLDKKLLVIENNHLKTTEEGRYILHDVLIPFMEFL